MRDEGNVKYQRFDGAGNKTSKVGKIMAIPEGLWGSRKEFWDAKDAIVLF